MKKKVVIILAAVLVILAGAAGGFYFWQESLGYKEVIVEAGTEISPSDLLVSEDPTAEFLNTADIPDVSVPGEYHSVVKTRLFRHKCLVKVQDTVAPEIETENIEIDLGASVAAENFVKACSDATEVKFSFSETPDFEKIGNQTVKIMAADLGGNFSEAEAVLSITVCKRSITSEAGNDVPPVADFLTVNMDAFFVLAPNEEELKHVGEYPVRISVNGVEFDSILNVVDTVAPEFEVSPLTRFVGQQVEAKDFAKTFSDATDCSFSFVNEPDFKTAGEQTVSVVCTDEGGNSVVKETTVKLVEDKEPPVFKGVKNILTYLGRAVSFKSGVSVSDNSGEEIDFTVDIGNFNINVAGDYNVSYKAVDPSGNETVKTVTVTIIDKDYSDEKVFNVADEILAKIITPGMSDYDKAQAIFKYIPAHLTFYSGESTKISWQQGALDGFIDKTGDCFIYASMATALLKRAGIQEMSICRSKEGTAAIGDHYWNLVNVGDGWYHFDCLPVKIPRPNGTRFFMWTDEQAQNWDNAYWKYYHSYDAEGYPDIN